MRRLSFLALLAACPPANEPVGDDPPPDSGEDAVVASDALVELGSVRGQGGPVHLMDVAVADGFAVFASYAGAQVVDVRDPAQPRGVPGTLGRELYWVSVADDEVWISGRASGLGRLTRSADGTLTADIVRRIDYVEGTAVDADHVYAATLGGLEIRRRSDLAVIGTLPEASTAIDVEVVGTTAYVLDRHQGLLVVDVSDPAAPTRIGSFALGGTPLHLVVMGTTVVVAWSGVIDVIDVADPAAPELVSSILTRGVAARLSADGDRLAVANWADVRLYDLSDRQRPRLIAVQGIEDVATSIALAGDLLVVGDWDVARTFAVDVTARSPEITVVKTIDLFGEPGEEVYTDLLVRNEGDLTLEIDAITCDGGVEAGASSLVLAPGEADNVRVSFAIATTSPVEAQCTLSSNDVDEPRVDVDVIVNRSGLAPGTPAPDFTVPDLAGDLVSLSSFRDHVVVLSLFSSL